MERIPIIDISALLDEHATRIQLEKVAAEISSACREHGFFYISGHGVSEQLQADLETMSRAFFELPEDEKMEIAMEKAGSAWRGYFPVGGELTSGKPDLKEGIYFGTELDENHPKVIAGTPLHGHNQFPWRPADMKWVVLKYIEATTKVGHALMRGIAMSLDLPESYFDASITKDPFILFRIFHYPGQQLVADAPWGVGEHTDYGLLTILKQDEVGGLQVKVKGIWMDAPPMPNTFVCNIGDMLDRMTDGLYRSTPHRVLNTSGRNRLSFPLFFDPGFDAHVKPIANMSSHQDSSSNRWDGNDIYQFDGPYGHYLVNKVSKVFPSLLDSSIEKRFLL